MRLRGQNLREQHHLSGEVGAHPCALSCSAPHRLRRTLCVSTPGPPMFRSRGSQGVALLSVSGNQKPSAGLAVSRGKRALSSGRWMKGDLVEAANVSIFGSTLLAVQLTFMSGKRCQIDSELLVVCNDQTAVHASVGRFCRFRETAEQTHALAKRVYHGLWGRVRTSAPTLKRWRRPYKHMEPGTLPNPGRDAKP